MRRLLVVLVMGLFAMALITGCTAKESADDAGKVPAATKEAESMDTTAMDSAMMDTGMVEEEADSEDGGE